MNSPIYNEYRSVNGISEMNMLARQGFVYVDTIPAPTTRNNTIVFLMVRGRFLDDDTE